MKDCKTFNEHGNHNFDWDLSQECPDCGAKEVDVYEVEIKLLKEKNNRLKAQVECMGFYEATAVNEISRLKEELKAERNTVNEINSWYKTHRRDDGEVAYELTFSAINNRKVILE